MKVYVVESQDEQNVICVEVVASSWERANEFVDKWEAEDSQYTQTLKYRILERTLDEE